MGTLGIFLIGTVVTALVAGALVLLVYGAMLDGKTDAQADAAASQDTRDNPVAYPVVDGTPAVRSEVREP